MLTSPIFILVRGTSWHVIDWVDQREWQESHRTSDLLNDRKKLDWKFNLDRIDLRSLKQWDFEITAQKLFAKLGAFRGQNDSKRGSKSEDWVGLHKH